MRRPRSTLLAITLLSTLVALGPAGPADAHGDTIHFQIAGDPSGHPRATATWENDGDPVDEAIAGTLSAVSPDGHTLGPWPLIAVPGSPAILSTREALPAGRWTVTVECSFPALGRGQADLTVDAAVTTAQPTATPTAAPATTPASTKAAPPASAAHRSASGGILPWLAGVGVATAAATGTLILRARRRSTG